MNFLPLLTNEYIKSIWGSEFANFMSSGVDKELLARFASWDKRDKSLSETQLEQTFINLFFVDTWGYWGTGSRGNSSQYTLCPQYKIISAGQQGGRGSADLALGFFATEDLNSIPQVLCEFKDIKSSLDAPQRREGNDRSPVKQCFDYLKYSFDATDSNSKVVPSWAIVTDMNEFRLYSRKLGMSSFQQFFIRRMSKSVSTTLLEDTENGALQRFLFRKMFNVEMLLADFGKSKLEKIIEDQKLQEKNLEKEFYKDYQGYREFVFSSIQVSNKDTYDGTPGKLVQLTQRFLDRCIFILFCEDMGSGLYFPTNLLRNVLIDQSKQQYYDGEHDNIWSLVKQLFKSMRTGGAFTDEFLIPHFNGGLFSELPELENLKIPNKIFCAKGQGESVTSLLGHRNTLLYFSSKYNFGASGETGEKTITLYTLGRIFEQSITDLEYMESEAEGRTSIAHLNKRKRNGVYYTPEWVTEYIVRETIGAWLSDRRKEIGLEIGIDFSQKAQDEYARYLSSARKNKKKPTNEITEYLDKLSVYRDCVENLKVLDPSCGSGAFLIQALNYLLSVRTQIALEVERIEGRRYLFDVDTAIREILSKNIYGVDLNPESVEITQLALWLNTAVPGKPLSNLDKHIRNGNSLVGPDFVSFYNEQYREQASLFDDLTDVRKEKINFFDWETSFPEVFTETKEKHDRGFDCIVGNPPYVKLQNFRKINREESDYFVLNKLSDGTYLYKSAQTGNFDLYLLFIEKGLYLLNGKGRMGYIAPNVWLKNDYGKGLRRLVKCSSCMDRWIDFQSYQVFEEATTYTAIQFFKKSENSGVRFEISPKGEISYIDWSKSNFIETEKLSDDDTWSFMPAAERNLIKKLGENSDALIDSNCQIVVGLQTSADSIYHLERVESGLYKQFGCGQEELNYRIEDDIMHPLVSGPDAKRYQNPNLNKYILFPYFVDSGEARLYTSLEMQELYPNAWSYLLMFEDSLRSRENGLLDDDESWWAYGRNQSLTNQKASKLCVAQTVKKLEIFFDNKGEFFINNVRVNGILVDSEEDGWYLLGVLNSPSPDFVFRRISTPKANGYYESNKQYIAPLPIPKANAVQKNQVVNFAKQLQSLTTERRDIVSQLQSRLDGPHCLSEKMDESWIWAEVKTIKKWKEQAPENLGGREKTQWAREQREAKILERLEKIDSFLSPDSELTVKESNGEVSLEIKEQVEISAFVSPSQGKFLAAQWEQIARTTNITEKFQSKTFIKRLLNVRSSENESFVNNTVELNEKIKNLDSQLVELESSLNSLVYELYGLTENEITMIEAG